MGTRISLALSATALFVATLGATSLGQAALDAIPAFARNADKVDGIHASRKPKAGYLLPLGKSKKFPKSVVPVGLPGPQGQKGEKGEKGEKGDAGATGQPGPPGVTEHQPRSVTSASDSSTIKGFHVKCPSGMRVLGGGVLISPIASPVNITASVPSYSGGVVDGWFGQARETETYASNWTLRVDAVCARVAG